MRCAVELFDVLLNRFNYKAGRSTAEISRSLRQGVRGGSVDGLLCDKPATQTQQHPRYKQVALSRVAEWSGDLPIED